MPKVAFRKNTLKVKFVCNDPLKRQIDIKKIIINSMIFSRSFNGLINN